MIFLILLTAGEARPQIAYELDEFSIQYQILISERHADPVEGCRLAHQAAWRHIASTNTSGVVFESDARMRAPRKQLVATLSLLRKSSLSMAMLGACSLDQGLTPRLFGDVYELHKADCMHAYWLRADYAHVVAQHSKFGETSEAFINKQLRNSNWLSPDDPRLSSLDPKGVILPPMFYQDIWKHKSLLRPAAATIFNTHLYKCPRIPETCPLCFLFVGVFLGAAMHAVFTRIK